MTAWEYFERPFFSTWVGTWLIFLGAVVLLISNLFLQGAELRAGWTSLFGILVVTTGGLIYSASTFINSAILISIGGGFLTLGLLLFACTLAWEVNIDLGHDFYNRPSRYRNEEYQTSVTTITAMILIFIAIALLVIKSIQRLMKPIFGPANYTLYGSTIFGVGAFCYFILEISSLKAINNDEYHPVPSTAQFGGFTFTLGAWILLLAVSRSFYCLDLLIVNNFASMTMWGAKPLQSIFYIFFSGLKLISGILLVVAELLSFGRNRIKFVCATSALFGISSFIIALIYLSFHKRNVVFVILQIFIAVSFIIYSLGIGLTLELQDQSINSGRYDYNQDLTTASMAINVVAYFFLIWIHYPSTTKNLLEPGNYLLITLITGFSGCLSVFLASLRSNVHKSSDCDVACNGSIQLGYIFLAISGLMEFFFSIVFHDVALITSNEEITIHHLVYQIVSYLIPIRWVSDHIFSVSSYETVRKSTAKEEYENEDQTWIQEGWQNSKLLQLAEENPELVQDIDILIVGCGPSGLTLANELGIRNVHTMIIEQRPKLTPDSRFFNLSCPTVEGLKRLNLKDEIEKKAIPGHFGHGSLAATGVLHKDAKLIATSYGPSRDVQMVLGPELPVNTASRAFGSPYAEEASYRIMQSHQEGVLKAKAESYSSVHVKYGHEMVDFVVDKSKKYVFSQIKNIENQSTQIIRSRYLVGCDGPASFIARKVHAKFDGFVNLGQTRTVHIHAPLLLEKLRPVLGEALQYHVARPGYGIGWFVFNEYSAGLWTFFLIALADGRRAKDIPADEVRSIVNEFIGGDIEFTIISDTPWFWNLFFGKRFLYGNKVLLCGDAAHSWAPFGGIGGNTGYADANNLGWKLASVIHGWAHERLLESYNDERRAAGLRVIMTVLNFAPDISQLMRIPMIAKYPWLWWTIKYRWQFGSRGPHPGNHMMSEGISFGIRYRSQIIYHNEDHQGVDPTESPPNKLNPAVVAGGRLLHLRFPDQTTLFERIAMNGYTVLVIDPSISITDEVVAHDEYIRQNEHLKSHDFGFPIVNEPFLFSLAVAFHMRKIPVHFVDLRPLLGSLKAAGGAKGVQVEVFSLYLQQKVIIVRPDLYIMWSLKQSYPLSTNQSISITEIHRITQISCMEIKVDEVERNVHSTTSWLNRRFLTNIQGYRTLHRHATYFENEDKGEVLKMLAAKKKAAAGGTPPASGGASNNGEGDKAEEVDYASLTTKAAFVKPSVEAQTPPTVSNSHHTVSNEANHEMHDLETGFSK